MRSSSVFDSSDADDGHNTFVASKKNAGTENESRRLWKRDGPDSLVRLSVCSDEEASPLSLEVLLLGDCDGLFESKRSSSRSTIDGSCLSYEIIINKQLALESLRARRTWLGSVLWRKTQIRTARNSSCKSTSRLLAHVELNNSLALAQFPRPCSISSRALLYLAEDRLDESADWNNR